MSPGEHPRLPEGYRLDRSDPDLWMLRREDGSAVAAFSAAGAASHQIEQEAREDQRRRGEDG